MLAVTPAQAQRYFFNEVIPTEPTPEWNAVTWRVSDIDSRTGSVLTADVPSTNDHVRLTGQTIHIPGAVTIASLIVQDVAGVATELALTTLTSVLTVRSLTLQTVTQSGSISSSSGGRVVVTEALSVTGFATLTLFIGTLELGGEGGTASFTSTSSSIFPTLRVSCSSGSAWQIQGVGPTVRSSLIFSNANTRLVLADGASLTLSQTATVPPIANSYVQCSGTASGGQLIRVVTSSPSNVLFPIGTSNGYSPVTMVAQIPAAGSLGLRALVNQSGTQVDRSFQVASVSGLTSVRLRFTFRTADYPAGFNASLYSLRRIPLTALELLTLPTSVSTDTVWSMSAAAPVTVGQRYLLHRQTHYYSYPAVGNWSAASTWTTDATGVSQTADQMPGAGGPEIGDLVTIRSGTSVYMDQDGRLPSATTIQSGGTLVVGADGSTAATSGHNLGTLSATGRLTLRNDVFPGGVSASNLANAVLRREGNGGSLPASYSTLAALEVALAADQTYTVGHALTLAGNLRIESGTLAATGGLTVGGNITRSGSGVFSMPTGSTLTLNGAASQTISGGFTGSSAWPKLALNKTGSFPANQVYVNGGDVELAADATLTAGYLHAESGSAVRFLATAGNPIVSANSGISGAVQREVTGPASADFDFPLRDAADLSRLRPLGIRSASNGIWTARFVAAAPPAYSQAYQSPINLLADNEHYLIGSNTVGASAVLQAEWGTATGGIPPVADFATQATLAWSGGGTWQQVAGGGIVGSSPAPTRDFGIVRSGSAVAMPAPGADLQLAIAFTGASALPVTWLRVAAEVVPQGIRVSWATATETNSLHFVVQRSADGVAWTDVDTVAAAGTSYTVRHYDMLDAAPGESAGNLYYRIWQVDTDGRSTYSVIREVRWDGSVAQTLWQILPNPTNGSDLSILLPAQLADDAPHVVSLINTNGQMLLQGTGALPALIPQVKASLATQPAGVYVLRLQAGALHQVVRLLLR